MSLNCALGQVSGLKGQQLQLLMTDPVLLMEVRHLHWSIVMLYNRKFVSVTYLVRVTVVAVPLTVTVSLKVYTLVMLPRGQAHL